MTKMRVHELAKSLDKTSKELIEFLKKNQFGRATFLPISSIKGRKIAEEDKKVLHKNGVYGVASNLISYSSELLKFEIENQVLTSIWGN